jgi:SAM-dependent methyltransferase
VAHEFVRWLEVAPGARWLDVGCGTGALTEAILESAQPQGVVGVDPTAAYLERAREAIADERARFAAGSAQALSEPAEAYDAVVSGLVLNFVPDSVAAVKEFARVTRRSGTVAVYVWDYADGMEMLRAFWDAAVALEPQATALDEGKRFPICNPVALEECMRAAGIENVRTHAIDVPTRFRNFDDYWAPFLGGQGPAPSYLASIDDSRRDDLRELLRAGLPTGRDGSLHLVARAWAVRGVRR